MSNATQAKCAACGQASNTELKVSGSETSSSRGPIRTPIRGSSPAPETGSEYGR